MFQYFKLVWVVVNYSVLLVEIDEFPKFSSTVVFARDNGWL